MTPDVALESPYGGFGLDPDDKGRGWIPNGTEGLCIGFEGEKCTVRFTEFRNAKFDLPTHWLTPHEHPPAKPSTRLALVEIAKHAADGMATEPPIALHARFSRIFLLAVDAQEHAS